MRRISLALALVGAVAAAGCGGAGNTGSNPTGSTGDKGVAQGTFTITVQNGQNSPAGNDTLKIKGGRVVSTPAGIDCGVTIDAATQAAVPHDSCSATFTAGVPVTLDAQAASTIDRAYNANYAFRGWAGDCAGDLTSCPVATAANKADKYVVASFAGGMTGHPNYTDPSVHAPLVAPSCATCHGTNFQGQGLAVGCNQCHNASSQIATAATGLDVVIGSVSATAPITVNFRLLDKTGAYVDVTGANTTALPTGARWSASKNQPVSVTMALVKYGESNGNVLPYKSFAGGDPATVSVYAPQGDKTSGSATIGSQAGVACTPTAPCTCARDNPCTNAVIYTTGTQDGRACTPINPCTCNAKHPCGPALAATSAAGALTFDAATGLYTYVFSTPAAYPADLATQHVALWAAAYRQENVLTAFDAKRYTAVNKSYVVPVGLPAVDRQIVTVATCARCHDAFPAEAKADGSGWAGFHSGARINPEYCNICHYDARRAGAADGGADSKSFIHRIHSAEHAGAPTTAWYHNTAGVNGIAVTYPQDPRNCRECHPDTAQGNQYKTRPSTAACVGCHYNVYFGSATLPAGMVAHSDGPQVDADCANCHTPDGIDEAHVPVVAKDANNILDTAGGNSRTNAGALVAAGATLLPAGADRLTAEIGTVTVVADGAVFRPRMTFKLKRNGTDVQFNTAPATPPTTWPADELITGFTGSPALYFAWSVPQDGIATPADFNASANIPLKQIWLGTGLTGTKAATLTGPDGSGFYTVTFTGVQIAENAQHLTGGVGYAYDLPATQPLTQTNLVDTYPTTDRNVTSGAVYGITCSATNPCTFKTGGLIVPIPNVWKAADAAGFVARRAIVSNDRCNSCHGFLGVAPNFHVGQRNDGPTCSFCHTPNRTSSGWSANSKDFIHGIHGAKWRSEAFNWHSGSCPTGTTFTQNTVANDRTGNLNGGTCLDASGNVVTPSPWYPGVEFPGSRCTDCHEPGTYDFSAPASAAAVGNLLPSTVATGTLAASISTSPWVTLGAFGSGFSYATDTGVTTPAAGTTLVTSPITAACFACHDSAASVAHFRANGGKVYAPRSGGAFLTANESCLTCHGPSGISPIGKVHR